MKKLGVNDGARTRDIPDHNRVLYQLSYVHHVLIEYLVYLLSNLVRYRVYSLAVSLGINKDER